MNTLLENITKKSVTFKNGKPNAAFSFFFGVQILISSNLTVNFLPFRPLALQADFFLYLLGQANLIRGIACSPPWILKDFEKNRIKALKLKIIKNVPIYPEMHTNIFLCVRGGGGVTM